MTESVVKKVLREETSLRSKSRQKGAVCFEVTKDGDRRRARIPNDMTESITSKDPGTRDDSDDLREYLLPGAGKLGEDCGDELLGIFCTHCGEPQKVGRTCRDPDCPQCDRVLVPGPWNSWLYWGCGDVIYVEGGGRR